VVYHGSVLQSVAVCCGELWCFAVCSGMLQCAAACCSVLQRVSVCCCVATSTLLERLRLFKDALLSSS